MSKPNAIGFCKEVWSRERPYLVELIADFLHTASTLIVVSITIGLALGIISLYRMVFGEAPFVIEAIIYISDFVVLLNFIKSPISELYKSIMNLRSQIESKL